MRTLSRFVLVELVALLSLLIVAAVLAQFSGGTAFQDAASAQKFFFTTTLYLGFIPVAAIGAPIYFWLLGRGVPRWIHVVVLGITPGLVALLLDSMIGIMAMICGAFVASLTHVACRRLGPNSSFKPTPSARLNSRR